MPNCNVRSFPRVAAALLPLTLFVSTTRLAQAQGPNPFAAPPKNLKILKPEQVQPFMSATRANFGQPCTYCHVAGDFSSDANPKKEIARMMFRMVADINARFPDGKPHVTCYTCHRGEIQPKAAPEPVPAVNR